MSVPSLPGIRHPIAGNLLCTPEYYRVLSQVADFVRLQQDQIGTGSESIAGLKNKITALYGTLGPLISASGTGIVTRNGRQFGFVDPADSDNVTLSLDYSAHTITADLADVSITAGGTLKKRAFDSKGRLSQESAATTSDLAEGSNLYFTNGRISYTQSGTGAVARLTTVKALEQPSPQDYAAAADGVTNDTTPISNAIASSPSLYLKGDYLVTALANDYGVPLRGEGRILKSVTGGLRQLNSNCDDYQHFFGQEYLYALHNKLMAGTTASMLFSGDSTTAGGVGQATTPWLVNEVVLRLGLSKGHKLTATNAGHPNKTTAEWVSTYLTADLATAPTLYVVRWGINDPNYGMSIADFKTSLRAGLAQCRASYGVDQMAILLMVPNNVNDTPHSRDQKWIEQIRKVIRQAARDYLCAYMDIYALWHDANNGTGLWMDDTYGDGRSLHPANVLNGSICSAISRFLFPDAFDVARFGTFTPTINAVTNITSTVAFTCQWMRQGSVVTVSGQVNVQATVAGFASIRMTMPIASAFTSTGDAGGAGGVGYNPFATALIAARTATGDVLFNFYAVDATLKQAFFTYTYVIK